MTDRERADTAERMLAYADRLLAHYMTRDPAAPVAQVFDTSDSVAVAELQRALDRTVDTLVKLKGELTGSAGATDPWASRGRMRNLVVDTLTYLDFP